MILLLGGHVGHGEHEEAADGTVRVHSPSR